MAIYAVTTVERETFDFRMANAEAIRSALNAVQVPFGRWVGPAPRIVRRINNGSMLQAWETYVTWLMDVEERTFAPMLRQGIADQVAGQLVHISDAWSRPTVALYSEAINGPLGWWRSGDAARTRTALEPPTWGGRLDVNQNPIGPDSRDVRPSTIPEAVHDWVGAGTGSGVGKLLLIAGGVLALYYLGPALGQGASWAAKKLPRATSRASRASLPRHR